MVNSNFTFINDNKNIKTIVDYCDEANVYGIICFEMGLTLRECNREYFYSKLDKLFPSLKEKYIKNYGEKYSLESKNNKYLMKIFKHNSKQEGIITDNNIIFDYLTDFLDSFILTTLF